jgi:hypothetical protein
MSRIMRRYAYVRTLTNDWFVAALITDSYGDCVEPRQEV